MARLLKSTLLCVALLVVASLACEAVPSVNFLQTGDQYSWTVSYTATDTLSFARFDVFTQIPESLWLTLTTSSQGPVVGGIDTAWSFSATKAVDTGLMTLTWVDPTGQAKPSRTAWTGTFSVTVPNCQAVNGNVKTKGGIYTNTISSQVPAPVPEPSSLIVLCAGLVPLVLRKRR